MTRNTLRRPARRANYAFSMVKRWLTMSDGTRLATTIYMPVARKVGERFPVLLELLPYRKDDTFFLMDYPTYSYFASRGYITVKVDIRGTGASQGPTPPREYSDIELDDAVEIIRQLAEMPESNGNVAMWGISWSGFNAIQVAMRKPPQLKAIIAMHASDDLYHDDLHYVDGVLHLDPYHLFINHELGLPRTPHYKLDAEYFTNRFEQKPWIFTYLAQQEDGDFWRRKSLRFQGYDKIDIPVYMIGGLNDGYRDTVIRMLEKLSGPVRADIGPWGHSSPDDGVPGPNFEWQNEAMDWLSPWLTPERAIAEARNRGSSKSPNKRRLMAFVRDGHEPDLDQETSPGSWRVFDWPATGNKRKTFHLAPGGKLVSSSRFRSLNRKRLSSADKHVATAGSGTAAGWWWGETTADMRNDDSESLVYDKLVTEPVQIVGLPEVSILVSSKTAHANWSLRLEDVSPSGKVTLVTGALVNGAHLVDRLNPAELVAGKIYELKTNLHFTTWTFQKDHRIRLAVSNAQFPMAWPSRDVVETAVHTGAKSVLVLPTVPCGSGSKPQLPKVVKKKYSPFGEDVYLEDGKPDSTREVIRRADGTVSFRLGSRSAYDIKRRRFIVDGMNVWTTNDKNPESSSYEGMMQTTIISACRKLQLTTRIKVESDKRFFHIYVTRTIRLNGRMVRTTTWSEKVERRFH